LSRRRYQKGSVRFDKKRDAWVVRYYEDILQPNGETKRVRPQLVWSKKEVPTKPLAQRRLDLILSRINDYSYQPTRIATVAEFAEQWREEVLLKYKPSSALSGKSHLDYHIIPKLGKLRLEQLGAENQQLFVNSLTGATRKTVLNILSTLSSMLTTAENWGYATRTVEIRKLRLPDRNEHVPAHFTKQQVEKILNLVGEPWRTFFLLLALTGMRAGEALGLQWGDIDHANECIHIRRSAWYGKIQSTKTARSAVPVPMPKILADALLTHRGNSKSEFLFVTRNGRPPSSNKVVEYQLWPALDALGISRCGLHAFRHAVASMLHDLGYSVEIAQKQLRHSNPRTTMGYTHIGFTKEPMDRLADSLKLDADGRKTVPNPQYLQ
jgi:integrase